MIVLDTHAWLWLASDPDKLGKSARHALRGSRPRGVAAVSGWEIAALAARGRIELDDSPVRWMEGSLAREGVELLPLTPAEAALSSKLGALRDPFDRLIVGTAMVYSADLVTADERISGAKLVRTIW